MPVKLYSFPTSPYGWKVGCYLAYKQLDYEFIGVSPITYKQIAFANKKQVPVLSIGEKWMFESSDIGIWLDETFPEKPLLGKSEAEKEVILSLDKWVSHVLIPSMFRIVVDWPWFTAGLKNGWKLAEAVHQATPLPRWVRFMWPFLIRKAGFIKVLVNMLDTSIPLKRAQQNTVDQFIGHLKGGPFLGGMTEPSLADLSAYPIIVFPHRLGVLGDANWSNHPEVKAWAKEVEKHLPVNPFLVDESLFVRKSFS